MGYKEQLGIEAGLQGGSKVSDDYIPEREQHSIIAKAKQRKEEVRNSLIVTALQKTLFDKVRKGEITARQADMIERGADPRKVFN